MGIITHGPDRKTLDPKVLLVEDDGITARYVQRCLCRAGFREASVATSAEEALALACAEPPDIVLMDVVLRGKVDGLEAARWIQHETDAAVVYLTARSDPDTRRRAIASGARGYLTKPFLPQELEAAIAAALPTGSAPTAASVDAAPIARRTAHQGTASFGGWNADHSEATLLSGASARTSMMEEPPGAALTLLGALRAVVPDTLLLYEHEGPDRTPGTKVAALSGQCADLPHGPMLAETAERVHPDDRLAATEHVARLHRADVDGVVETAVRVGREGKGWRWLRYRDLVVARDADGVPRRFVGSVEDITAQREAAAALAHANRLSEVARMVAPFAHEISNPLQGVVGCLGLLEEALAEGRDADRFVRVARSELQRATRLVAQFRGLAGNRRSGEMQMGVDPGQIVIQVAALMEKRCADQGMRIVWKPDTAAPTIVADPDAIQQVFLNLVLNALDALPNGGSLVITEHATDDPPGVRVVFADDGPGVAPHIAPQLFTSFVTTKSDGMGLGLPVSHDIVARHGGRLYLDTSAARGARFVVWLPVGGAS